MIESIHEVAARLGVEQPVIERQERQVGKVIVSSLTAQSEQDWSKYLTDITMAKLALNKSE